MVFKVDPMCSASGSIHEDYICMLNQTNIAQNNNKFYKIQLIDTGSGFCVFIHYGRVGEAGRTGHYYFGDAAKGIAEFKKKFKSKTGNNWDDRENFKPKARKYDLVDMAEDDDDVDELEEALQSISDKSPAKKKKKTLPCTLDARTKKLMDLIFDQDMFKTTMAKFDLDVKKMPLGKLSEKQIQKGNDVLDDIEAVLKKEATGSLSSLSSRFYSVIPHAFGRRVPPSISSEELLQKKRDMLAVLGDIVIAQSLKKEQETITETQTVEEVEHPTDIQYKTLGCTVTPVDKKSDIWKMIETYVEKTGPSGSQIQDIFELDRSGSAERFAAHDDLQHRKLLWHGTNVAVVCAILKTGLRIMPHSGGRVGKGIYMASEMSKSYGYTSGANGSACMFLAEGALGKEHSITMDDHRLVKAPKGYDSIVARGHTEPDPKKDTTIELDGHTIIVPQGAPISQKKYANSNFSQSEYLVYKESQVRLRYLIKIKKTGWW
mmetsp:Transcript_13919/g.21067  ORF Transcript_13919/g.21067 Transcript_13919/m.21067 type:complete len:489 (+) Transcript_13919:21-1487(+)